MGHRVCLSCGKDMQNNKKSHHAPQSLMILLTAECFEHDTEFPSERADSAGQFWVHDRAACRHRNREHELPKRIAAVAKKGWFLDLIL